MQIRWWFDRGIAIDGAPGIVGLAVAPEEWRQAAEDLAGGGARLLALWAGRGDRDLHRCSAC